MQKLKRNEARKRAEEEALARKAARLGVSASSLKKPKHKAKTKK